VELLLAGSSKGHFLSEISRAYFQLLGNREVSMPPGSPGKLNPGGLLLKACGIAYCFRKPQCRVLQLQLHRYFSHAEAILYDLAGRAIAYIELPDKKAGNGYCRLLPLPA
jgi:hypothetical protein